MGKPGFSMSLSKLRLPKVCWLKLVNCTLFVDIRWGQIVTRKKKHEINTGFSELKIGNMWGNGQT
jgi:hypothetical protein